MNFDNLFLYVPIINPDAEIHILFNDSNRKSFTLSFDSWSTDRQTVDTQLEYQVDNGSAQILNSLKYLLVAHQTAARTGNQNKANNIAIFDNLNVREYHVDIDGVRSLRDGVSIAYASNDYVDQYGDLKLFHKEYVGEVLLSPFISYIDSKNKRPIRVIDLKFQVDLINPKKVQFFEEYRGATHNAKFFMILIRHKKTKMISDVKLTEIKIIWVLYVNTCLRRYYEKYELKNDNMNEND